MEKREKQFVLSKELLELSLIIKQKEEYYYSLLKEQCINLALIAESLGMRRQTAYYKLKTKGFNSEELERFAKKAVEIYKIEL